MAELLDEIYEICLEKPDMWPDHRNVEQFVGEIAAELDRREEMTQEEIRDKLYELQFQAQRAGFKTGFRYGMQLQKECMIDNKENGEDS